MNKYQLYTLGGALLAATSLSGAAQAAPGVVGHWNGSIFTASALKISNTAISGTASVANAETIGGPNAANGNFGFLFQNTYNQGFNLNITVPVTGAAFVGTPVARYLIVGGPGATGFTIQDSMSAGTLNGSLNPVVGALSNSLFISNVQISNANNTVTGGTAQSVAGVILEGVSFTQAAGLATVGGSISVGATVASQSNQALIYETIASAPIVTSIAPVATSITAGVTANVAVGGVPVQFAAFAAGGSSVVLATIGITGTGALATDLSTTVSADSSLATDFGASTGINITVASTALSDPAAVALYYNTSNGFTASANLTAANFAGGSATFSISNATVTYAGTSTITLAYSGITGIQPALAGTVSLTYSAGGSSLVAPASASGATTVISRGGLGTQVNWANSGSASGFTSYIRIHNSGTTPATATIVVKKDTLDGSAISTVGTYTTPTVIPAGGSIQVSVPTIEAALGVTANAANSYTLLISGAFPGYVQHLSLAANGSLVDLDGFRDGNTPASNP